MRKINKMESTICVQHEHGALNNTAWAELQNMTTIGREVGISSEVKYIWWVVHPLTLSHTEKSSISTLLSTEENCLLPLWYTETNTNSNTSSTSSRIFRTGKSQN